MKTLLRNIYDELKYSEIISNQRDFAEKLGYHETHISKLMKSDEPLPEIVQNKINKLFGISQAWLTSNGKEGKMFARDGAHERVKTENINSPVNPNPLVQAGVKDNPKNSLSKTTDPVIIELIATIKGQQQNESDFAKAMIIFAEAHRDVAAALKNITAKHKDGEEDIKSKVA